MRPGILTEHGFKHKGNHYATLPWFGTKIAQTHSKRIKTKTWSSQFSSRRETPRSHVLNFRATSGHNVLYMRSNVSKEMSRFRLPSLPFDVRPRNVKLNLSITVMIPPEGISPSTPTTIITTPATIVAAPPAILTSLCIASLIASSSLLSALSSPLSPSIFTAAYFTSDWKFW